MPSLEDYAAWSRGMGAQGFGGTPLSLDVAARYAPQQPVQMMPGIQQQAPVQAQAQPVVVPAQAEVQQEQPKYGEDEYNAMVMDQRRKKGFMLNKASEYAQSQLMPNERESFYKSIRDQVENDFGKDLPHFNETDNAKKAFEAKPGLLKIRNQITNAQGEVDGVMKLDSKAEKVARAQVVLPKLLQSLASGSPDALTGNEFIRAAPELVNAVEVASMNPSKAFAMFENYFTSTGRKGLEADPDAFMAKAMGVINSVARSYNSNVDSYIRTTSPKFFKTNIGVDPVKEYTDLDTYGVKVGSKQSTTTAATQQPTTLKPVIQLNAASLPRGQARKVWAPSDVQERP